MIIALIQMFNSPSGIFINVGIFETVNRIGETTEHDVSDLFKRGINGSAISKENAVREIG